jgi:hypothetical protein
MELDITITKHQRLTHPSPLLHTYVCGNSWYSYEQYQNMLVQTRHTSCSKVLHMVQRWHKLWLGTEDHSNKLHRKQ